MKAYLILVIINEENHFIKRYFYKNVKSHINNTQKIQEYDEDGKDLIKIIFGYDVVNKSLYLDQAYFIKDIKNWSKSIYEFKNEFLNIKKMKAKKQLLLYILIILLFVICHYCILELIGVKLFL